MIYSVRLVFWCWLMTAAGLAMLAGCIVIPVAGG